MISRAIGMKGGIVLREKGTLGTDFLLKLESLYAAGPKALAPDDLQVRKVWAQKMLNRARKGDIEGNYRKVWLLTNLLEDYFAIRQLWYRGPKESFQWLQKHQPQFLELYENTLKPGSDFRDLELLIEEYLK